MFAIMHSEYSLCMWLTVFGAGHMFVWVDTWPRLTLLLQFSYTQMLIFYLLQELPVLHWVIANGNVGLWVIVRILLGMNESSRLLCFGSWVLMSNDLKRKGVKWAHLAKPQVAVRSTHSNPHFTIAIPSLCLPQKMAYRGFHSNPHPQLLFLPCRCTLDHQKC